jgi:hypothetical protein
MDIYGMKVDEEKPIKEVTALDYGITFGLFYVDEKHGFGFEVVRKEVLKRNTGFKTAPEARAAGFKASKKIIDNLKNE